MRLSSGGFEMAIELNDRSRTLHRDGEQFPLRPRIDPHYFALTDELNRATRREVFHGHDETHGSMPRNHGGGFQQHAADADISAHRFELNHQIRLLNFQANRILQFETSVLALQRKRGPGDIVEFAHSVKLLRRPGPDANCGYAGIKRARRTLPVRPMPWVSQFNLSMEIRSAGSAFWPRYGLSNCHVRTANSVRFLTARRAFSSTSFRDLPNSESIAQTSFHPDE